MAAQAQQPVPELARVDVLVNDLASAFESGLEFYTKWKQKLETLNHYRRHRDMSSPSAAKDAVSTSLDLSCHRIRATYQVGFALIGPQFSAGDGGCSRTPKMLIAPYADRDHRRVPPNIDHEPDAARTADRGPTTSLEVQATSLHQPQRDVSRVGSHPHQVRLSPRRAIPSFRHGPRRAPGDADPGSTTVYIPPR